MLEIFDINGKKVYSSAKKTQPPYFTQDVNCAALAKGMYIVSLTTDLQGFGDTGSLMFNL